jgi:hypothetical protein
MQEMCHSKAFREHRLGNDDGVAVAAAPEELLFVIKPLVLDRACEVAF